MTFLKSQKRFGQFETLETKKLFAADLAASADVVSFNPGDCTSALNPGDCVSALTAGVVDPDDCPELGGQEGEPVVGPRDGAGIVDPNDCPELGGQEGEPVSGPATDIVLANLGGQEGEDVAMYNTGRIKDTSGLDNVKHTIGHDNVKHTIGHSN
jgi:hypothetical protein